MSSSIFFSDQSFSERSILSLFEMYQSGTVNAATDGIVSGIDKESSLLLSYTKGNTVELLADSPYGNDEATYNNYVGRIQSVDNGIRNVSLHPVSQSVADYKNLLQVDFSEENMTENGNFNPTVPIYELNGSEWRQINSDRVAEGDVLLFAGTDTSGIVWAVRVIKGSLFPPEDTTEPTPTEPDVTQPSTTVPDTTEPSTTVPGNTEPSTTIPQNPSDGNVTRPSGGDVTLPSDGITIPSAGDVTIPLGDVTMPSGGNNTNPSVPRFGNGFTGSFTGGSFSLGSFGGEMPDKENMPEGFENFASFGGMNFDSSSLTYTGETKTYTVPEGMKIGDGDYTSLKVGDVIMISFDQEGGIAEITVMPAQRSTDKATTA